MSGTFTTVTRIEDREVQAVLQRLERKAGALHPCLKNMGEHLVNSTQERFDAQEDPAGQAWAALKAATVKRKKIAKILTESSGLRSSVIYAVRGSALRVGTNKVYAAAHQFGLDKDLAVPAHKRAVKVVFGKPLKFPVWAQVKAHTFNPKLPARPFLGISASDRVEIMAIARDFLER